jgi:hypothetical protein
VLRGSGSVLIPSPAKHHAADKSPARNHAADAVLELNSVTVLRVNSDTPNEGRTPGTTRRRGTRTEFRHNRKQTVAKGRFVMGRTDTEKETLLHGFRNQRMISPIPINCSHPKPGEAPRSRQEPGEAPRGRRGTRTEAPRADAVLELNSATTENKP